MIVKFEKYIEKTKEAKELKNVFEYFFSLVENAVDRFLNDIFIKTASLPMIRTWEEFLQISPSENSTIEERRAQILLKKIAKPPYTLPIIQSQVSVIVGSDVPITLDENELFLTVNIAGKSFNQYNLIKTYLNMVKPSNIPYIIGGFITYNEDFHSYMGIGVAQHIVYDVDGFEDPVPIPWTYEKMEEFTYDHLETHSYKDFEGEL